MKQAMLPPARLPPPPFWRTLYFERARARSDRQRIKDEDILSVLRGSAYRLVQPDGRYRCWGWLPEAGRWLRVVTLEDGETVHNAFFDRSFSP